MKKPHDIESRRIAVIGGTLDGKSSMADGIARGYALTHGLRAIVFDPWKREEKPHDWGKFAWVTDDFDAFRRAVANTRGCVVVWDEGTSYGGRDRENIALFTAVRHRHPVMIFIGHNYSVMLPVMRESLSEVLLAKRTVEDATAWGNVFVDMEVRELAPRLEPYEFLHKRKHQPCRVLKHTPEELARGVML